VIAGAGHSPQETHAADVLSRLDAFLSSFAG